MIEKLYQLIQEASTRLAEGGWTIIFTNQNITRPVKPYMSINVLNVDIPDHVIYSGIYDDEETTKQTISGWRSADVEIQIYNGINSLDTINKLALVLQSTSMVEFAQTLDVAVGQRLFISYVPELLSLSQYEGRGIYQFKFLYTEEYTETVHEIVTVELTGSYSSGPNCEHSITILP